MPMISWTQGEIDELLRLRGEGLSTLEISKVIGRTRNSVCGKLERLTVRGHRVPPPQYVAIGGRPAVKRPRPDLPPPGLSDDDRQRWLNWRRATSGAAETLRA